MNNDDNSNPDVTGVSRRASLTLAVGVAEVRVRPAALTQPDPGQSVGGSVGAQGYPYT
jgi:hypothetical protein